MKRLTMKNGDGYSLCHDNCPKRGDCYDGADCAEVLTARLGEYEDAEEAERLLILPCKVGDTVMAYLEDAPKKGRSTYHLSECKVTEITFSVDYPEPYFTAVCKEKALFDRFWLSDFNMEIFTPDQYWAQVNVTREKSNA
jgi:hypothetical protein